MKKILFVALIVSIAFGGYLAFTAFDSNTSVVNAAKAYNTTVYVAGHGGHFAKAEVTVDPNNTENPIKINGDLDMVNIGTTVTHKTHDARIDSNDSNVLFWSTYALDDKGKQHVGKSDLKTGDVIKDVAMDPDPRAPGKTGPLYCASGQSKNNYMPIFMGSEGYIDVLDKKTLEKKHRMFISDIGYKAGTYMFVHGVNSNDMKKFLVAVTMKGEDGKMNGKQDLIMVDNAALDNGKWKVLYKTTLTGEPSKTITFRQYFSTDDKLIFQAGGDRFYLLDASNLKIVDEKMTKPAYGENHDSMPSPDGKYALLTLRTSDTSGCDPEGKPVMDKEGKALKVTDGVLALYDVNAKKLVGKSVSVCFDCHKGMGKGDKNAVLCGLDANWKK
ncbi:MAG: hypothetical protein A2X59_12695 [Nitrospirae bacterium GWC2_42_7]|nr:MAG: hypothetical protein A2X59_12695 [Nitrospirae bacterium GWC2_42_7]